MVRQLNCAWEITPSVVGVNKDTYEYITMELKLFSE